VISSQLNRMGRLVSDRISSLIATLEGEWVCPQGMWWNDFCLTVFEGGRLGDCPTPLILSASGSAPSEKLGVLKEQLQAAEQIGRLDIALEYLNSIPKEKWQRSNARDWSRTFYSWE
jgi:hypothetical protein